MILIEDRYESTFNTAAKTFAMRFPGGRYNNNIAIAYWLVSSGAAASRPYFYYNGSGGDLLAETYQTLLGGEGNLYLRSGIAYLFGVTPASGTVDIYKPAHANGSGRLYTWSFSNGYFNSAQQVGTTLNKYARYDFSYASRRGGCGFGVTLMNPSSNFPSTGYDRTEIISTDTQQWHFYESLHSQKYPSTERVGISWIPDGSHVSVILGVNNSKLQTRPPLPGMI